MCGCVCVCLSSEPRPFTFLGVLIVVVVVFSFFLKDDLVPQATLPYKGVVDQPRNVQRRWSLYTRLATRREMPDGRGTEEGSRTGWIARPPCKLPFSLRGDSSWSEARILVPPFV